METFEIQFQFQESSDSETLLSKISDLLGIWFKNGQISGGSWPSSIWGKRGYRIFVSGPEIVSLDETTDNEYAKTVRAELSQHGTRLKVIHIGHDSDSAELCVCKKSSWYLLWTSQFSSEPPIRCGDCFGVLPLYWFPSSYFGEFFDVVSWETNYQACDRLQMNCSVGERFGTREMSRIDSSLSKAGRKICQEWTERTGVPTYYYLYRYGGRSWESEQRRLCPGCGGTWLLSKAIHGKFDMKCERCRLVSNISWCFR